MIEYILIRNFRKHKKRSVRFSPDCTTFVGENDAGKSTILLALWWLFTGRPLGTSIIRRGAEACSVEVGIDGHVVIRKKGRNRAAIYKLDGKTFKAMGNDVPPAIRHILNVNELNYQRQVTAPFWLTESPGQLSRALNAIVNLEDIDNALSKANSELRSAEVDREIHQRQTQTLSERVESLTWTKQAGRDIERIQSVQKKLKQTSTRAVALSELLHRAKTLRTLSERLEGARNGVSWLCSRVKELADLQARTELLDRLIVNASELYGVCGTDVPSPREMDSDLNECRSLEMSLLHQQERTEHLRQFISDVKFWKSAIKTANKQSKPLTAKLSKLKRCPLCQTPLSRTSGPICTSHTTPPSDG